MGEISKHDGDEPVGLQPVELTEPKQEFQEPVPVENIIPGIKEAVLTVDEQVRERRLKNDRGWEDNFWSHYINKIANKKLGNDTPNLLDRPDVVEGKTEKEAFGLELFKNQIVVDLGAGGVPAGYLLSELLKARAYVGVELYNYGMLETLMSVIPENKDMNMGVKGALKESPDSYRYHIPYSLVHNDMLSFLKRLPDSSVSILMGGVDIGIISDDDYRKQVFKEIERVLTEDGGFLCQQSNPPSEVKLEIVHKGSVLAGGDYIFRKPKEK